MNIERMWAIRDARERYYAGRGAWTSMLRGARLWQTKEEAEAYVPEASLSTFFRGYAIPVSRLLIVALGHDLEVNITPNKETISSE